jgi:lipid IVA palmitoyltransferase
MFTWFKQSRTRLCLFGYIVLGAPALALAENVPGFFSTKWDAVNLTLRSGNWELYTTGYAWHLPWAYDASTRSRLNSNTWGGGFGRSLPDGDHARHSVFLLGFSDSHHDPQFILGYNWQRYWGNGLGARFGAGYMAFLSSRRDVARYLPIPALLPCVSLRYRKAELVTLFVPRVSSEIKGDVIFLFLRMER